MNLIAFDQSPEKLPYAVFDLKTKKIGDYGKFEFKSEYPIINISDIKNKANKLIDDYSAKVILLEDIYLDHNPNVYKISAELIGVLENSFLEQSYEFHTIPAKQWKGTLKIKGRKRQEQKENTIKFVKQQFGIDVEEDIADAICLGWGTILKYKL